MSLHQKDHPNAGPWKHSSAESHIKAAKGLLEGGYTMDAVAHALVALSMIQLAGLQDG